MHSTHCRHSCAIDRKPSSAHHIQHIASAPYNLKPTSIKSQPSSLLASSPSLPRSLPLPRPLTSTIYISKNDRSPRRSSGLSRLSSAQHSQPTIQHLPPLAPPGLPGPQPTTAVSKTRDETTNKLANQTTPRLAAAHSCFRKGGWCMVIRLPQVGAWGAHRGCVCLVLRVWDGVPVRFGGYG